MGYFVVPIVVAGQLGVGVPMGRMGMGKETGAADRSGGLERRGVRGRRGWPIAENRNKGVAEKWYFVAEFVPIVPIFVAA